MGPSPSDPLIRGVLEASRSLRKPKQDVNGAASAWLEPTLRARRPAATQAEKSPRAPPRNYASRLKEVRVFNL
jgi:hypothetical protein